MLHLKLMCIPLSALSYPWPYEVFDWKQNLALSGSFKLLHFIYRQHARLTSSRLSIFLISAHQTLLELLNTPVPVPNSPAIPLAWDCDVRFKDVVPLTECKDEGTG